jgi:hypothetical protein
MMVSDVALSDCGHLSSSRSSRGSIRLLLSSFGSGRSSGGGGSGSGVRGGSGDSGGCGSGGGTASSGGGSGLTLSGGLHVVVLLSGRVNGDLDSDLTTLNLLSVHLRASLLLELLGTEGNETETTALAGLTTSLELLDHEAGDGAESDLGLGGGVVLEDLEELGVG